LVISAYCRLCRDKKQNKEAPLAEFHQKNCRWLCHNRSRSPCRHGPHVNRLIAQAVSIKILAALFQQHLHAIVRTGRRIDCGSCRLQTLPRLHVAELTSLFAIDNLYIQKLNIKIIDV
jgi:hypothetical protein